MRSLTDSIKIALLGGRGVSGTAAALQTLAPHSEIVPPAAADVIGFCAFDKHPYETQEAAKTRVSAAITAAQENPNTPLVAVVDSAAGRHFANQFAGRTLTLATEYGASATWHLAITLATLKRVGFVLQGDNDHYLRAHVPGCGRFKAHNFAYALLLLLAAGCDFAELANAAKQAQNYAAPWQLAAIDTAGSKLLSDYQGILLADQATSLWGLEHVLEELTSAAMGQLVVIAEPAEKATANEQVRGAMLSHSVHKLVLVNTPECATELATGVQVAGGKAKIEYSTDYRQALTVATAASNSDTVICYIGANVAAFAAAAQE